MSRKLASLALTACAVLGAVACTEPGATPERAMAPESTPQLSAVKFWDANAAANWNELATSLTKRRTINALRMYPYLSLAQLRASEAAEQSVAAHPPTSAAIGAASAVVLSSFFPLDVAEIQGVLAAQEAATPWPGAKHADWDAGEAIGRAAAARVIAYSLGDKVGLTDPGTPPVGPGKWFSSGVIARGNFGARPFYLSSTSELRPPPPPAFGSPAYLAALAEVRLISDTRTPEQLALAQFWNVNQSPAADAVMNGLAVEFIRAYRTGDTKSARALFLMNSAAFDALIACFDAKYTYWLIRPAQADPLITLPIGLPPHPSYPSAHSCISGASTTVLAAEFPSERTRVLEVAKEASLSRLYGGLHYRFDLETGLAMGQAVGAKALAANLDDVAVR